MVRDVDVRRQRQMARESQAVGFEATRNLMVIFVMMVFLGFPGTLSKIIGKGTAKMVEYAAFGLQFVLIMMASGSDVMEIKLINLEPAYSIPYIYVLYTCVDSLLVSINVKTVFITVVHMVLTVMFAIWLVEQYDLEQMLEIFYSAQFVLVAISLISVVIFPKIVFYSYHGSRTFRGLFDTKNECGTELAFGVIVQAILLKVRLGKNKQISVLFLSMIVLQFGLILLTKNMGAVLITGASIGYVVYYGMQKKKVRFPLGLLFIVGSIGFLFFALTILQAFGPFLESIGKDASLTGRVPLWEQQIAVMQESHTMTGYGMEMYWKTPSAVKKFHSGFAENTWAAEYSASMHNMIMEMWGNIGLIGLALYFYMFFMADRGIQYLEEDQYLFCSSYMVMFTVRSLTERQSAPASVYVLLSFVILAMMYQAYFKHMNDKKKKVRVYKAEDTTQEKKNEVEVSGDLMAFQRRFSNFADSGPSRQSKPLFETSRRQKERDIEEEEAESQYISLLDEFDDHSF